MLLQIRQYKSTLEHGVGKFHIQQSMSALLHSEVLYILPHKPGPAIPEGKKACAMQALQLPLKHTTFTVMLSPSAKACNALIVSP